MAGNAALLATKPLPVPWLLVPRQCAGPRHRWLAVGCRRLEHQTAWACGLHQATASHPQHTHAHVCSVTAERWVPLIEVTEALLVPWLLNRRAEG